MRGDGTGRGRGVPARPAGREPFAGDRGGSRSGAPSPLAHQRERPLRTGRDVGAHGEVPGVTGELGDPEAAGSDEAVAAPGASLPARAGGGRPPAAGSRRLVGPAAVGLLAGFLSGLFGVGGGILMVPGLVLVLGMEQRRAHGTSLAAIIPIGIAGVVGYALDGSIDVVVAALLLAGSWFGALVGTSLLQVLPQRALRLAFAVLMLATAVRLFVEVPERTGRADVTVATALGLVALGFAAGVLAGLLGVGGGIVMVPAMVLVFGLSDVVAKGTSLLVIIPTASVGTLRNARRGAADLAVAATLGLAGVASAFAGSRLAVRLDPRVSTALFAVLLLFSAAQLLWRERRPRRPAAAP